MSRIARLALLLPFLLSACAADSSAPFDDGIRLDDGYDGLIKTKLPEAATALEFVDGVATSELNIHYGQPCELVSISTTPDGNTITSNSVCQPKWEEVAWLGISSQQVNGMLDSGKSTLDVTIDSLLPTIEGDSVKLSVHALDSEGNRTKLASEPNISAGESLSVALTANTGYSIYSTRGANSYDSWNKGLITATLSVTSR